MTNPSHRRIRLDRRTVLRGGVGGLALALGLPRFEAMLNNHGTAHADGTPLPRCFATWFWGNGIDPARWVPTGTGPAYALSEQLAPLAGVKDYLSVVTNLKLNPPRFNEPHVNGPVGILTGDDFEGSGFQDGTVKRASLDQVIAGSIAGGTRFRSLEVRISGYHGGGTAIDHISHNGPGNPNRGEIDCKAVFDRLFGSGFVAPGSMTPSTVETDLRRSVLDFVAQDAQALRGRLGVSDQRRLDQHLEAVRGLEQAIKNAPPPAPTCVKPTAPDTVDGIRLRNEIMSKLVAMALACDLTRVVSFEFSTPASHVWYPDAQVEEDIHEWGHTHGVDDLVNRAIVYFMENFATFLSTLADTADGAGNLLDRACVFGTSCTAYGPSHKYEDWPLLIAGRAGGALKHPGVHVRPAQQDTASRVPLTLLQVMGVPANEWGVGPLHTDKPLGEILV